MTIDPTRWIARSSGWNGWPGPCAGAAEALHRQRLPRLFEGGYPAGVFFGAWLVALVLCVLVLWSWWALPVSAALAALATGGLLAWLRPIARRQSVDQFQTIQQLLADARQAADEAVEQAQERARCEAQALTERRDEEIAAAQQKLHTILDEKERWRASKMSDAGQTFPSLLAELRKQLGNALSAAEREYNQRLAELTADQDRQIAENQHRYDERFRQLHADHDQQWEAMAGRWQQGLAELRAAWLDQRDQCAALFPDWDAIDYDACSARTASRPACSSAT